jgi:YD repeat-containing protein
MNSTPLHCPQIDTSNLANWTGRPPGHEPVLVMRQGWNAGSDLEGGTVRFGWNGRGLLLHATLPDRDIFNPVTEFNEPAYLKGDVVRDPSSSTTCHRCPHGLLGPRTDW